MAGSVVSFLLEKLPLQLVQEEAIYLYGVRDEVNSFQNELNLINVYLEHYAKKRSTHKITEEVLRQIRDLALRGEYAIDSYIYNSANLTRRNFWGQIFHSIPHFIKLRCIRKDIKDINSRIEKINNDKGKYVIEKDAHEAQLEAEAAIDLHNRRTCLEEIDTVGFDHHSTTLVKQLTEGKPELDVSSILGMGGLGKTTLARKVYKDNCVKKHFDCRVWVYVSQDFRSKELQIEISNSLEMEISESERKLEGLGEIELKKLTEHLRGKKYLVVMDDVWTTAVWNEVKEAFPDNSNGSRILLTSRDKQVLLHASRGTYPYLLPFLTAGESWELLRRKVFQPEECPPELETVGRQIAESCDGLPLSIVVLAGLLAGTERREVRWEEIHRNLIWHLRQKKEKWAAILFLSYTQLPQYLKPCFLYFGVYPENFKIPVRQLTQLWTAEGFIEDTKGSIMEDVAENYLRQLIDRCLIQVDQRGTDGEAKTCRIHDLLRDLCISESTEEKFLKVSTDDDLSSEERTRRLSILRDTPEYISHHNPFNPSCARSLLFFGKNAFLLKEKHWKWVFKYSKFVRVLNFGHAISHCIPDDIEKLMYLKYLRIDSTYLDDIPSSICNLQYLETLDARGARGSELNCLPDGIWKLQCLRNLYLSGSSQRFPSPPPSPSELEVTLSNLQILSTVTVDPQITVKLPNLRKLGMKPELQPGVTFESLGHLQYLQILKITNCSKFPSGAESLPLTITKITLIRVHLNNTTVLGNLPKLRVLKLQACSSGELSFTADSFRVLEVLKLYDLSINEWELWGGARLEVLGNLPKLRVLKLQACSSDKLSFTADSFRVFEVLKLELGGGAMPHLMHLIIKGCTTWKQILQEFQMKMNAWDKEQIDPPLDDRTYQELHLERLHI